MITVIDRFSSYGSVWTRTGYACTIFVMNQESHWLTHNMIVTLASSSRPTMSKLNTHVRKLTLNTHDPILIQNMIQLYCISWYNIIIQTKHLSSLSRGFLVQVFHILSNHNCLTTGDEGAPWPEPEGGADWEAEHNHGGCGQGWGSTWMKSDSQSQ